MYEKTRSFLICVVLGCAACTATPPSDSPPSYAPVAELAKPLPQIIEDLQSGATTSVELVTLYLDRIERLDRSGPQLRSMISINPNALDEARKRDAQRQSSAGGLGPLHGVPIVLKDNIESRDPMPTTAGALALADNLTERDAPLVAGLRDAGAIVLGKANLSQWANFRSDFSISGWSALGGQVRNPHMLDRSPCGSSSGSAAAVAASLAAAGIGTETNGSIICPANVNGLVGFKPTVGIVSQQFIIPISASQDTAGPLTKSVEGAALLMNAMHTGPQPTDYVAALDADALQGRRVGVLRFAQGENPDVMRLFDAALEDLKRAGATLIDIDEHDGADGEFWDASFKVLLYEFKQGLNDYLTNSPAPIEVRSLEALIEFNDKHADQELSLFGQDILDKAQESGPLSDESYRLAVQKIQRVTRQEGIDALLRKHNVDVLVSPSGPIASRIDPINGDVWPSWAGAGSMAAIAGYPHASVPMGQVHGVPLGLSFIGARDTDPMMLSFAYAYEQLTQHRQDPQFKRSAEDREEISNALRSTQERSPLRASEPEG